MRKLWIGLAVACVAAAAARAQIAAEPIPAEFLQQFAPFATALFQQQFPNPPVKLDLQADKAVGYHVKEMVGIVAVPDRNLSARAIEEIADRELPAGVVTTKSLSIQDRDTVINGDRLALLDLNGAAKLPVFFLAIRASGNERVLAIYAREAGKPLLTVPLKKQAGDLERPIALKLANIDPEKRTLEATLSFAGSYEATLKMAYVEL